MRSDKPEFQLQLVKPFSTFTDGAPTPIPYIIDGLFPKGGLSLIGAKPKAGKSCISRYAAVCVAKGLPFLGRYTERGEVLLVNLEDSIPHVDNHLAALGYNDQTDSPIHIVPRLAEDLDTTLGALRRVLQERPEVRLVVVDTLAKLVRVRDSGDYTAVMVAVEKLHKVAKDHGGVHIVGLIHSKKVSTSDPFDQFLGSTAFRGESETNIVIYQQEGQRVLAAETRAGRPIEPTALNARMVTVGGSDLVQDFSFGEPVAFMEQDRRERTGRRKASNYTRDIVQFLASSSDHSAMQGAVLSNVSGANERLLAVIRKLEAEDIISGEVLKGTGSPRRLTLNLDPDTTRMYLQGLPAEGNDIAA